MIRVNVHEAKTNLSKLLKLVSEGETVQICNRNEPVANITAAPNSAKVGKRAFGLAAGEFEIPDSFFDPLPDEEIDAWYNSEIFPQLPEDKKAA